MKKFLCIFLALFMAAMVPLEVCAASPERDSNDPITTPQFEAWFLLDEESGKYVYDADFDGSGNISQYSFFHLRFDVVDGYFVPSLMFGEQQKGVYYDSSSSVHDTPISAMLLYDSSSGWYNFYASGLMEFTDLIANDGSTVFLTGFPKGKIDPSIISVPVGDGLDDYGFSQFTFVVKGSERIYTPGGLSIKNNNILHFKDTDGDGYFDQMSAQTSLNTNGTVTIQNTFGYRVVDNDIICSYSWGDRSLKGFPYLSLIDTRKIYIEGLDNFPSSAPDPEEPIEDELEGLQKIYDVLVDLSKLAKLFFLVSLAFFVHIIFRQIFNNLKGGSSGLGKNPS